MEVKSSYIEPGLLGEGGSQLEEAFLEREVREDDKEEEGEERRGGGGGGEEEGRARELSRLACQRISRLAIYVCARMGGFSREDEPSISERTRKFLERLKREKQSNVIPLGSIVTAGTCR